MKTFSGIVTYSLALVLAITGCGDTGDTAPVDPVDTDLMRGVLDAAQLVTLDVPSPDAYGS